MSGSVTVLSEWDSKQLLGLDLPRPHEARTTTRDEALQFASSYDGPFVAKASGMAHKSDAGLVRLGLSVPDLGACWAELAAAGDGTVLIAEHVHGELELIIGGSRDASFGPLITVGIGGVAAQVFSDVAVLLSPPEPNELEDAVSRLRASALFAGYRGSPPVELAGLALIVDLVAQLLEHDPDVVEIDCNPVLVCAGRPTVLDVLVAKR